MNLKVIVLDLEEGKYHDIFTQIFSFHHMALVKYTEINTSQIKWFRKKPENTELSINLSLRFIRPITH